MSELTSRRKEAKRRFDEGHTLTKFAESKCEEESVRAPLHNVELSTDTLGYATGAQGAGAQRRTVDLAKKTCSCNYWAQHKRPCRHAIAVAKKAGLIEGPAGYKSWIQMSVDEGYTMKAYHEALQRASAQLVSIDALESDGKSLPNIPVNQPGRPRKKRIRTQPEGGSRQTKVCKCGACGNPGHNKRNCPNAGL